MRPLADVAVDMAVRGYGRAKRSTEKGRKRDKKENGSKSGRERDGRKVQNLRIKFCSFSSTLSIISPCFFYASLNSSLAILVATFGFFWLSH